jgi:hypothetical protein
MNKLISVVIITIFSNYTLAQDCQTESAFSIISNESIFKLQNVFIGPNLSNQLLGDLNILQQTADLELKNIQEDKPEIVTMLNESFQAAISNKLCERDELSLEKSNLYVDAIIKKLLDKNSIPESRIKNKTCWIVAEDKEAENMALKSNMTIYIPSEAIKESKSEDELAFKLAHELSHFLLHHRHRLLSRENLPHTQKIRYFKALELEADSMAIKMLANSGYNLKSAEHFFKKHRDKGEGFHPSSKQRHLNLKIQTDGISKHEEGYFNENDKFIKYKYKKPKLSKIPRNVLDEVSKMK